MTQPMGIRLPKEVLDKIEKISKNEMEDRSTVIRKLVLIGYKEFMKKKAFEEYLKGNVSFSKAAEIAGMSLWEMEKYLISQGYKSEYSIEDLEKEIKLLN